MKIAVLFSGRIDRFDEHFVNWQTMVAQEHDVDVFLSTVATEKTVEHFCALYQPVSVRNEAVVYDTSYEANRHPQCNYHNMMCMYTHRLRVWEELETHMHTNHTKYDLVISMRLDAFSDEVLDYGRFVARDDHTLYIPDGFDWGGINDQFAAGSVAAMRTYMTVMREMGDRLSDTNFGPEIVLARHLAHHSMTAVRFPFWYRLINGKMYHHHTDPF